jgi:alpha-ribazole phosphatase/probable phosphoglycerate mutase
LLLIRHGESTWNFEHRIQGQLDPPLSEEGRRQAERLGGRLLGQEFAGFYCSDLKRAFETAELIAAAMGGRAEPLPALREIYLGEWEGLHTEELAQRFPEAWRRWTAEPNWDLVPGGEGAARFERRVVAAVDGLFARHPQGDVLVVTHGGVIQIALHSVLGRPSHGLFVFRIQNASITVIEKRNGRIVIGGVNDTGHLEPAWIMEPGLA